MSTEYYEKNRSIEEGIRIKGTHKIFKNIIKDDSQWSGTSFNLDLCELIDMVKDKEEGYSLTVVQDINQMGIEYIDDIVIIFKCPTDYGDKYFFLNKKESDDISMAFKTFSKLLTVPVSFSKRNPGDLNKINFKYYQYRDNNGSVPIRMIHDKETKEFEIEGTDGGGGQILAHRIETLIKGKNDGYTEDIRNSIPMLYRILGNIRKEVGSINPEIEIKLHSYVLGYGGFNKGRHFVRLVFDNHGDIEINDEMYQLGLDIETDFSGNNRDAGTVFVIPTLFRVVGETAFNIPLERDIFLRVRNEYAESKIHEENIGEEGEFEKKLKECVEEFSSRFDEEEAYIKIQDINYNISGIGIREYLNNWINGGGNTQNLKERLEKNTEGIEEFRGNGDKLITDILSAGNKLNFKAKEAIKYLILEYVAGVVSGEQVFGNYLDILHFLTMIGLSYTSDIQREINRKAFKIVEILTGTQEFSIFDAYKEKLQMNFNEVEDQIRIEG